MIHLAHCYAVSCQFTNSTLHPHLYHSLLASATELSSLLSVYHLMLLFLSQTLALLPSYLWFVSLECQSLPTFSILSDLCLQFASQLLNGTSQKDICLTIPIMIVIFQSKTFALYWNPQTVKCHNACPYCVLCSAAVYASGKQAYLWDVIVS